MQGLARRAVKDTEILGRYVPAGTRVAVALLVSQRLEPWWPDPDTFDPERFSPERREDKVHRYAWVPFGGGPHKCIGMSFASMQVKSIMHQVLHLRNSGPGYVQPWRVKVIRKNRSSTTSPSEPCRNHSS